jgi:hypothetical protein
MRLTFLATATVAAAAVSRAALADPVAIVPWVDVAGANASRDDLRSRNGVALTIGVGTTSFFSRSALDLTSGGVGVYGDLRVAYGTRSRLCGELAYTLSGRKLSEEQFGTHTPVLFGHGPEALLRLNHPMSSGRLFISPFVLAGLGWIDFVRTDSQGSAFHARETDRVGTIPVGAGLALGYRNAYAEARFMYRPTYNETGLGGGSGHLDLQAWFAGIAGGVEF